MKKNYIVIVAALLVGVILVVSARNFTKANAIKDKGMQRDQTALGEYQYVKLRADGFRYVLDPNQLQANVPVRMEVDLDTVYGCLRSIVIPAFNVRKNVFQGDNIIEFTPDKTGTFRIACSMNMGQGSFDVIDNAGEKSAFIEEQPSAVAGGSCTVSGNGGCGCGCKTAQTN